MKKDEDLIWTPVQVEHIVQDQWIDFRRVKYRYPDGREFAPFYNYSRRSYSIIVPTLEEDPALPEDNSCRQRVDNDNSTNMPHTPKNPSPKRRKGLRFLCVRQFRHGIGEVTTEFPAGGIESEGTDYSSFRKEAPLDCAKRELQEETGYVSDDWTHLITIPSNATLADNYAYVYLARNCHKVSSLHLDTTEDLEPEILTQKEIETRIEDGKFQQATHVMAYLLALRQLDNYPS